MFNISACPGRNLRTTSKVTLCHGNCYMNNNPGHRNQPGAGHLKLDHSMEYLTATQHTATFYRARTLVDRHLAGVR